MLDISTTVRQKDVDEFLAMCRRAMVILEHRFQTPHENQVIEMMKYKEPIKGTVTNLDVDFHADAEIASDRFETRTGELPTDSQLMEEVRLIREERKDYEG